MIISLDNKFASQVFHHVMLSVAEIKEATEKIMRHVWHLVLASPEFDPETRVGKTRPFFQNMVVKIFDSLRASDPIITRGLDEAQASCLEMMETVLKVTDGTFFWWFLFGGIEFRMSHRCLRCKVLFIRRRHDLGTMLCCHIYTGSGVSSWRAGSRCLSVTAFSPTLKTTLR